MAGARGMSIGGRINQALTGSARSLLEQAIYPKTDAGNRTLGPLLYGAFYSGGTYLGFPKNYYSTNTQYYNTPTFYLNSESKMPYYRRNYYRRYGRRYSRYGGRYARGRYGRRYYRRYF